MNRQADGRIKLRMEMGNVSKRQQPDHRKNEWTDGLTDARNTKHIAIKWGIKTPKKNTGITKYSKFGKQ